MIEPKKAPDVMLGMSSDITQAYLAAIIKSSNDAIIAKNLDGTITSWNAAAQNIFGYTPDEAVGQNISLIIPEDRLHEEVQIISKLRTGQSIDHFETVRRAKDGRMIDLSISVSPIRDGSGVIIGASKVARDITEKKRTERLLQKANEDLEMRVADRTLALQQQSAFLKAILDSISDGVVACDANGSLNLFNRATTNLHDQPNKPLQPEEWARFYHLYEPDGKSPMKTEHIPLLRALNEGVVKDAEMVIIPPDAEPRQLIANGQALYDENGKKFGAMVSMHDVTEQRKQQQALIESRAFLRTIIDTVADPIFVKDDQHRLIEGNIAFWNLVGAEEEIRGKTDHDLFPKEQADKFWEGDNRILNTGQPHDAEEVIRDRNGNDILIWTRKMPLVMPDGKKALVGIVRDVTQQRNFEEELRQHRSKLQELVHIQTKDLIEAKERAEASSIDKGEFLANISHEIRSPMNAVIGIAQLLKAGKQSEAQNKELLETLDISAHQIMELINNMLDVSRIRDASFSLESVEFDLKDVITEVVSINKIEAQNKKILLECKYKNPITHKFMGDPVRLRQVIMNLVGNALKFTSEGFVRIDVDCPQVDPAKDSVSVKIDILDTGVGIPSDKMEHIFHRYAQADSSVAKKYGGTGLGLAISKQLAEMMGGEISAHSDVGVGSCFTVKIPLRLSAPIETFADETGARKTKKDAARKPCILLVEDYEPNVLVTGMLLNGYGYDFVVAANGKEALARMEEGGIDLVLMDVQMPIMNGFTATRMWRVKESAEHKPRIPIIGMTAHAQQEDRERCEFSGMDDYVSKPFDSAELREKIASLLAK